MLAIGKVQTNDRVINQLQDNIAASLNPIINNALTDGILLTNISLVSGANVINHKLNRKLQGWVPVRVRASATFYDTQDSNKTPEVSLYLNASAAVVVDLYVF